MEELNQLLDFGESYPQFVAYHCFGDKATEFLSSLQQPYKDIVTYNIDATSELLMLEKQIGNKLREEHIIKPLIGIGFKQRQDDNGALWKSLNSKKNHFIVIKTDEAYWGKVWIAVTSEDKTIMQQSKLDCFTHEPTKNYPYGWSWISDNKGNNWRALAQYPTIGKEEVLTWIKDKISEIETCFKI